MTITEEMKDKCLKVIEEAREAFRERQWRGLASWETTEKAMAGLDYVAAIVITAAKPEVNKDNA